MLLDFSALYREKIVKDLASRFGYKSVMEVPKLLKITVNMGVGAAAQDKKLLASAKAELALITGQKVIPTRAKKSVAGFKIRQGWEIGCKVTLRNQHMYDFLARLVKVVFPRVRDFRGYSVKGFDGRGNYSLGIREQIVFLEIDYDKIDKLRGLDVAITTTAKTDKEAYALLLAFGFPFKDALTD